MTVDILAFGAHPDDVEMTIGGLIAKSIAAGRTVVIADMTRGEMGTRGTPETRATEAAAAAKVLGVSSRVNLNMGDGRLENTMACRDRIIALIREYRPTLVLGPHWDDLHPDHAATGAMVRDVMYPCGFAKHPVGGEAHRPREFLFYLSHFTHEPSFVVDIPEAHHETKMRAVACYASQFHQSENDPARPTWIATKGFMKVLESRAVHYGSLIHAAYGEPLISPRTVPMSDPVAHYQNYFEV